MTLSSHDLSAGSSRFPALEDRVERGCFSSPDLFVLLTTLVPTQLLKAQSLPACEEDDRKISRTEVMLFRGWGMQILHNLLPFT
jgi:hypothetical protein